MLDILFASDWSMVVVATALWLLSLPHRNEPRAFAYVPHMGIYTILMPPLIVFLVLLNLGVKPFWLLTTLSCVLGMALAGLGVYLWSRFAED